MNICESRVYRSNVGLELRNFSSFFQSVTIPKIFVVRKSKVEEDADKAKNRLT